MQAALISFGFGAYGIVMLFMYIYSNFANDAGAGMFKDEQRTNWIGGILAFIVLFVMLKMFGHFSLYYMFPFGERWVWFILFSIANSVTFFIIDREFAVLNADRKSKLKIILVVLLPFILASILLLIMGIAILAMTLIISALGIFLAIMFGRILQALDTQIIVAAGLQGIILTMLLLSFGITIV